MSPDLPDELRARPQGPRAADHALQLYARALHPELVTLARSRRLEVPGLRARVGLLVDTGHLIEAVAPAAGGGRRAEPKVLVELLAPISLDLPPAGRIDIRRVGASTSGTIDDDCGLPYVCSWSFERARPEEYATLHARILEGTEPRGERLLVNRGHPENEGPAPFSMLDVDLDEDARQLDVFVVHAFPADRAFLFVHTRLVAPA